MAAEINNMAMDLTASIWHQPGTFDELYKRGVGVLKNVDEYNFNIILRIAKSKGWIYEKNQMYYCYKKTVKEVLNPNGYEIDLAVDTRSEFRKQFDKMYGG